MAIFSTVIDVNILILCMDLPVTAMETNLSECAQGFFGPNCTLPCRFPNYGKGCQLGCDCRKEHCNHITGCPNPATKTATSNTSKTHRGRSVPDNPHTKSTWNRLDGKHKAMLVSICIMVAVFLILTSVYLTKRRKTEAIISYYYFRQKK